MKRLLAALLWPALLLSLGWSLRGQFGHLKGASIPGALVVVALSLVFRDPAWGRARPLGLLLSVAGFSLGGTMGYGALIDRIVEADSLTWLLNGLVAIFLIGAVWGGLGLSLAGFGYSESRLDERDLVFFSTVGVLFLFPILRGWEGSEVMLLGASLISIQLYNFLMKRSRIVGLLGIGGAVGFGIGFLTSVLILCAGEKGFLPGPWRWWSLRDQIFGAIGGLTLGILALQVEKQGLLPKPIENPSALTFASFFLFLGWIPFVNGLNLVLYWSIKRLLILKSAIFYYVGGVAALWLIVSFFALRKRAEGPRLFWNLTENAVFYKASVIFIAVMTVFAVAKETVVFGLGRWELGFTVIVLEAAVACLGLGARIARSRIL